MATALGLFGSRANLRVMYILFKSGTRCGFTAPTSRADRSLFFLNYHADRSHWQRRVTKEMLEAGLLHPLHPAQTVTGTLCAPIINLQ